MPKDPVTKRSNARRAACGLALVISGIGSLICIGSHQCMCGHLKHGRHEEITPWLIDSIWHIGLVYGTVVGLFGGFHRARVTGLFGAAIIAFSILILPDIGVLGPIFAIPAIGLGIYHLASALKKESGKQHSVSNTETHQA